MIPHACRRLFQQPRQIIPVIFQGHFGRKSSTLVAALTRKPRTASIASLLNEEKTGGGEPDIVTVNGWIRSNRNMKKWSFLHIADGSTVHPIQAIIPKGEVDSVGVKK